MRQRQDQIDQEYLYAQQVKKNKQLNDQTLTADHADRLGKATAGSFLTNPFVTATIGLSDSPIDSTVIHNTVRKQYEREFVYDDKKPKTITNHPLATNTNSGSTKAKVDPTQDKTLLDLLSMPATDYLVMPGHTPAWWERVDPTNEQGQNWRSLQVPELKTPEDLLNLSEQQLIKFYIQNPEKYSALQEQFKPTMITIDPKTKGVLRDENGDPVPSGALGTERLLKQKFPTFYELKTKQIEYLSSQQPTGIQADIANFINEFKGVGWVAGLPARALSLITPDYVGPAGGVQAGGVNIPLRADLTKIGDAARAVSKTVTAGFMGAAQFTGSTLEYAMTHPSELSTLGVAIGGAPGGEDPVGDYYKTVLQGNVLTQIIKRGLDPNKNLDLGGGFFPEGPVIEEARKQHDAGLPKIAGKTWSAGRYVQEPFIQAGLIDRDGYAATILSGLFDMTFDVATDIGLTFDPVRSAMKLFNLTPMASSKLLDGAIVDLVNEGWAAERKASGQSTVIKDTLNMVFDPTTESWVYGAQNIPVEDIPKFGGILPRGTVLPPELEAVAREQADKILSQHPLATMDSPPPAGLNLSPDTISSRRSSFGIIDQGEGFIRPDPMAIDAMPYTRDGRAALTKLASFENSGQLYNAFLGNIPIGAVQDIQDLVDAARLAGKQVDLNAIHKVLVDGVLSGDPMYHTFNVPGVANQMVNQTGSQIAQWASGRTRQLATMPGSTFFSFDDPMSSIKDMNNLMIVMKVSKSDREVMLAQAIRAVTKEGPGARFELASTFVGAIMGPALRKNGVPEEWIRDVTKYALKDDGIRRWAMDSMGAGFPAPWLQDGIDGGIFRTIDGMNSGFVMISPEGFQQAIREVTNVWKAFKPLRGTKAEVLFKPNLIDALENLQKSYLKPVALGAPFPVRMVSKIIPDEMARIVVSGEMSSESLLMLGHKLNYTTHGVEIATAKKIGDIGPKILELDSEYARLATAQNAGDSKLVSKIQNRIDSIENKFGTRKEMQKQIDVYNERIETSLPGANRKLAESINGLMADELADPRVNHWKMTNLVQNASAETEPAEWVIGTAKDIVKMSLSQEYPVIVQAMLDGRAAVAALPDRFLNGDLKWSLEAFIKTLGKKDKTWDWTNINDISHWVATRMADISNRTSLNHDAMQAIATGKFNGQPILLKDPLKLFNPTPEFKAFVKDSLLTDPNRSLIAPYYPSQSEAEIKRKSQLMTRNFKWYRNTSNKMARIPLNNYTKWQTIIDLMPTMDPDEARKMADAIAKTDAPKWLHQRILDNLENAKGTSTRKQVEILGEMAGNKAVTDLLYNSSKKSYFGARHTLSLGFFDAWFEQWSVWSRQIAQQPSILYKAQLAQNSLEETQMPAFAGGLPNQGILFKDPDTGKQAVAVPFSRNVYKMLGIEGQEQISTQNLTLFGQVVPGVFGVGAIIQDSVVPKNELWTSVRKVLSPFGDQQMPTSFADIFAPAWAQGLVAGTTSLVGGKLGTDLINNIQQIFATDRNDIMRSTAANAILSNIADQRNGAPLNYEEAQKLLEDTSIKTDLLLIWKSLFKVVSPAASITKYYEKLGPEYKTQGQVLNDLREMTNDPNVPYSQGIKNFLTKHGDNAWIYLSGSSSTNPGFQPTEEYSKWYRSDGAAIDKYPNVGGFLGPQMGVFSPSAWSDMRAAGKNKPKPTAQKLEDSLNNYCWNLYDQYKNTIIQSGVAQGLTPAQAGKGSTTYGGFKFSDLMKAKSDEIKTQYAVWSPLATFGENERKWVNQKIEINRMVKDKKIVSLPVGESLKEYWDYRNTSVNALVKYDPSTANDSWRNGSKGIGLREALTMKAQEVISKNPDFKPLWERILSKEFTPLELETP